MACVLITGATGLIGKMFVRAFLSRGDMVVYTTSSEQKIADMEKAFPEAVSRLKGCIVDLLADNAMTVLADFFKEQRVYPDYVINNARSLENVRITDYHDIAMEKWLGEYQLDVVVPYQLSMMLLKNGKGQLKGIINISSMYGMLAYNDYLCDGSPAIAINYGVAKAALVQLTKELAVRLAAVGVRVNAISYGGVSGRTDADFQQRYARLCPMQKMLTEEEVAGHALYLCSEASAGMTGQNIVVDGGFSAW